MKLYNDSPNFSIIAPGECNASCSFCFWQEEETHEDYKNKLIETLTNLPKQFHQISITGGEPCISPYIYDILEVLQNKESYGIDKVVLTTNGTGLEDVIDSLDGVVDFVNISRHHWDEEKNSNIFQTSSIPSNLEILALVTKLNKIGISANMNTVVTFNEKKEIERMIHFGKEACFSSIAFRHQHGSLDAPKLESYFDDFKARYENTCPVCRSKNQIINGMSVNWKSSVVEPQESFDDDTVYELVFHSDGRITTDWEGKSEVEVGRGQIFSQKDLIKMAKSMLSDYTSYEYDETITATFSGGGCRPGGGGC